jgi:hypothetical protein
MPTTRRQAAKAARKNRSDILKRKRKDRIARNQRGRFGRRKRKKRTSGMRISGKNLGKIRQQALFGWYQWHSQEPDGASEVGNPLVYRLIQALSQKVIKLVFKKNKGKWTYPRLRIFNPRTGQYDVDIGYAKMTNWAGPINLKYFDLKFGPIEYRAYYSQPGFADKSTWNILEKILPTRAVVDKIVDEIRDIKGKKKRGPPEFGVIARTDDASDASMSLGSRDRSSLSANIAKFLQGSLEGGRSNLMQISKELQSLTGKAFQFIPDYSSMMDEEETKT